MRQVAIIVIIGLVIAAGFALIGGVGSLLAFFYMMQSANGR
jgi:hypothetical protein